jgi:type I restriction enzyme, S subunit
MRNDTPIAPVLRFEGYNESWHDNRLSDLIQLIESGWSPQCATESAGEHEWGVLRTTSVSWDGFDDSENKRLPDGLEPRPEIEVATGDILVTRAGPSDRVGVVAYVRRTRPKIMLPDKLIRLRVKALHCPDFIARCLGSQQVQDQLKGQKSGLAKSQTNISQQGLLAVRLVTPTLPEQQKIAAFLTAVDGRIEQLSRKKALLEEYKKGVMQQLFTQTLRFQDDLGHDFPDWEEKTLGELCTKVGSGKTPKGGEQVYQTFGVKFIRSQNVAENRLDLSCITFVSEAINTEMKGTEVKPLDVLLNITGASIGRSCVVPSSFDRGNVNQHVCIIRPQKTSLDPIFLQLFLSSRFGQKLIEQGQSGSGREGLNFQSIRSFTIPLPSLPEQTKITSFLSALDGKIGAVGEQMRQTQAWKKGLLQQLFV